MAEVDLCVKASFLGSVQEVGDEQKWVPVFDGDLVESAEADAESETTIFLFDEEDWCSVGRASGADYPGVEVFIQEFPEGLQFHL